jgi:hemoglobin
VSIYDAIGGRPAVDAAVSDFYQRVLADPSLSPYFAGVDVDRLKRHQRAFIGVALGGPAVYAGRDMATAHAGLDITSEAFDAVVQHLAATLTSLGVPDATIGEIAEALVPLKGDIVTTDRPIAAPAPLDEPTADAPSAIAPDEVSTEQPTVGRWARYRSRLAG